MSNPITTLYGRAVRLLDKIGWAGPLLVRLTLGLVFLRTGWGKLHSLDDVTQFFESLNIPAAGIQAKMVSGIEFGGGLLLIAGFGTRIVSALLIGVMAVAIWTAKLPDLHGVFDLAATDEFAYLAMFVWLVLHGAGLVSIDHLIARRGPAEPRVGVAA
jgi:putative oxidoreductase